MQKKQTFSKKIIITVSRWQGKKTTTVVERFGQVF